MIRPVFLVLACAAMSGCGGGGEASFGFSGTNLSGASYSGRGVTAKNSNLTIAVTTEATDAQFTFAPSSDGGSGANAYTSVTLDLGGARQVYFSDTGNVATSFAGDDSVIFSTGLKDGPATQNTLFVTAISTSGLFAEDVGFYVLGNQTPAVDLPSVAASYSGRAVIMDGSNPLDISGGTFNALVNFAGTPALSSGSIVADTGTLAGTQLNLTPAALAGASFETTLTSADVTLNSSYIEGRFFGPTGSELAGTTHFTTPSDTYVGMYGAMN